MFSGNKKISGRQMYRNYAAGFVSLNALLIPVIVNQKNAGGAAAALIFTGLYLAAAVRAPKSESAAFKILCYVHYWALGTMAARMAGLLIQEFLLTDVSLVLILSWFYLFCYYNLYKGLECRSRVSEILFPFFMLLFVILSFLALGETDFTRCRELEFVLDGGQIKMGYELFVWLSALHGMWNLKGRVQKGAYKKTAGAVWLTGALSGVFLYLFTYGIYGDAGHTGLVFPLASAMTLAHFPGNVIGRLDAPFVFAWTIGLFLLCSTLFAPPEAEEPDTRRKILLFALMALSFTVALQAGWTDWCRDFLCYVSVPIQILLLLWQSLKGSGRRGAVMASGVLLSAFLLCGCGNQELEERGIVTAVSVDMGEEKPYYFTFGFGSSGEDEGEEPFGTEAGSLAEAKELYYETNQKNMDFNHLKNFYFSEELLADYEKITGLLEEIQLEGSYSRGIMVYAALGKAEEEADREVQPKGGTPIHRILDAWYNGGSCEISAVTEEQVYKGSVFWP